MSLGTVHTPAKRRVCDFVVDFGNRILRLVITLKYESSPVTPGEPSNIPPSEPGTSPAIVGPSTPPLIPSGTSAATRKSLPKPAGRKRG